MSFFLSVFFSASVGTPGSMFELDANGKYSALTDFGATPRLRRSAALRVAVAEVDGNTTDNGDIWDGDPWGDDLHLRPGIANMIFSGRMMAMKKKQRQKRRASKGTPSATASSSSTSSSASAPNKRQKRTCAKRVNYASLHDDDDDFQ